jgi:hypothetical protein
MIAAGQDFPAGQPVEEKQVRQGILQLHSPGYVAGNHDGVILANRLQPILFQPLFMVLPANRKYSWVYPRQNPDVDQRWQIASS